MNFVFDLCFWCLLKIVLDMFNLWILVSITSDYENKRHAVNTRMVDIKHVIQKMYRSSTERSVSGLQLEI